MPTHDLAALACFPLAFWGLLVFTLQPDNRIARHLHESWAPETREEASRAASVWAIVGLATHFFVACATMYFSSSHGLGPVFLSSFFTNSFWLVAQGLLLGLALVGIIPFLRLLLPESRRFRLLVLVASGRSLLLSFFTIAAFTFVHEFWRVSCLRMLIADGYSGRYALAATSIAYGVAFLTNGVSAGISEAVMGAIYAALFLWEGYFVVPFAAHLLLQMNLLVFMWATPPGARPSYGLRVPSAKCPACGVRIDLRVMERGPTFSCPSCRTTLSASDSRTALIRWGSVFLLMGIAAIGFRAFEVTRGETESTLWFAYALAFPIFCGLQLTLPILFPPKLQCGDPQFIALNLTETVRKKDTDDAGMGKSQKSDDSPA